MSLCARQILAVIVALSAAAGCAQRMAEPAAPGYAAPPPGGTGADDAKPAAQPGYGQAPSSTSPVITTLEGEKKQDDLRRAEEQAFTRVEDAEAALERARAELAGLGIESRKPPKGSAAPADAAAAPSPAPKSAGPLKKPATAATDVDARCESACKALSSLKRAADGVCRLAGDSDARCTRARGIVKDSEGRVAACKCEEKSE